MMVYGIANCDSAQKARARLQSERRALVFRDCKLHDSKRDGLSEWQLERWIAAVGWGGCCNLAGYGLFVRPERESTQPADTWL